MFKAFRSYLVLEGRRHVIVRLCYYSMLVDPT